MNVPTLMASSVNLCLGKYLELSTIWTKQGPPIDRLLSQKMWRTRQIGFLFSKQGNSWIFLVLVAPLSMGEKDEYKFCYRDPFVSGAETPYSWIPSDIFLRDLIIKIKTGLRGPKGHRYLNRILRDILWGWERYFAQVRGDITGVWAHAN